MTSKLLLLLGLSSILGAGVSQGASPKNPYKDLYHNAYLALEEGDFRKVMKIWYIHNSIENSVVSKPHLPDLKSATWLAIDQLRLCPDNMLSDSNGGGLWPIILHNYVVRNHRSNKRIRPLPDHSLSTFETGIMRRPIHLKSILSPEEIRRYKPYVGKCQSMNTILEDFGLEFESLDLDEKEFTSVVLRKLLHLAASEVNLDSDIRDYVAYRIFLINLYHASRSGPTPDEQMEVQRAEEDNDDEDEASEPVDYKKWRQEFLILMKMGKEQWLNLPMDDRRAMLSLYNELEEGGDPLRNATYDRLLSYEITAQDLSLLPEIIGFRTKGKRDLAYLNSNEGQDLIALGKNDRFPEIGALVGPLGVEAYHKGDLVRALEYFSVAIRHSSESSNGGAYYTNAMNWVKYIIMSHRFNKRLLNFTKTYLPKGAYKRLISSLVWSGAFHKESHLFRSSIFKDPTYSMRTRKLVAWLKPLALGQETLFISRLAKDLKTKPRNTIKQLAIFMEKLEEEPLPVIKSLAPLLSAIRFKLENTSSRRGYIEKKSEPLKSKIDEVLAPFEKETIEASDRRLKNGKSLSLGSLRLEPSYVWPWPFNIPDKSSIHIFRPIDLTVKSVAEGGYKFMIPGRL